MGTSSRKRWVLLALLLIGFGFGSAPLGAESIRFGLDWLPYGAHAPYFAARALGLYKAEGLEVGIERGYGSREAVKRVFNQASDFGLADPGTVFLGRRGELKARVVAIVYDKGLATVVALKGSGINSPRDLDGKTFGDTAKGTSITMVNALSRANGNFRVKHQVLAPAMKNPSLLGGKVDAIGTFATTVPALRIQAQKTGKDVVNFNFSDWGVDVYGLGIVASDAMIEGRPDTVRKFVRATLKALKWSAENQEAAIGHFLKSYPEQDRALALSAWDVIVAHMVTPVARTEGLGYMVEEKVAKSIEVLAEANGVAPLPPGEVYTNAFLPDPRIRIR